MFSSQKHRWMSLRKSVILLTTHPFKLRPTRLQMNAYFTWMPSIEVEAWVLKVTSISVWANIVSTMQHRLGNAAQRSLQDFVTTLHLMITSAILVAQVRPVGFLTRVLGIEMTKSLMSYLNHTMSWKIPPACFSLMERAQALHKPILQDLLAMYHIQPWAISETIWPRQSRSPST